MTTIFLASVSFIRARGGIPDQPYVPTERAHNIHFTSESKETAIGDVFRWIRNRQKNLPETFGVCGCVKLYRFAPGPIAENGQLQGTVGFPVYEWKYDWGQPAPDMESSRQP